MNLPPRRLPLAVAALAVLAGLGLACRAPTREAEGMPFSLRRVKHTGIAWNTGTAPTWWEYTARWRGRPLRFTAPAHRWAAEEEAPEDFSQVNDGYGLGKVAHSGGGKEERIDAEALLVSAGPDPSNAPRWFLLEDAGGALRATWLSSSPDDIPVWLVSGPGQARRPPPGDERIYGPSAELGLSPLRSWEVQMALPAEDPPRFLLVGTKALLEVATRRVHALPRAEAYRMPLGFGPDGRSFLFLSRKDDQLSVEQVALEGGARRWLPLAPREESGDVTRAWLEARLEWQEEAPGGVRWARWREAAAAGR